MFEIFVEQIAVKLMGGRNDNVNKIKSEDDILMKVAVKEKGA